MCFRCLSSLRPCLSLRCPQPSRSLNLDFSSLLGPLFYVWLLQLLFPVALVPIVCAYLPSSFQQKSDSDATSHPTRTRLLDAKLFFCPCLTCLLRIADEKEHRLRMMIKMMGMDDKAYWVVTCEPHSLRQLGKKPWTNRTQ